MDFNLLGNNYQNGFTTTPSFNDSSNIELNEESGELVPYNPLAPTYTKATHPSHHTAKHSQNNDKFEKGGKAELAELKDKVKLYEKVMGMAVIGLAGGIASAATGKSGERFKGFHLGALTALVVSGSVVAISKMIASLARKREG